MCILLWAHYAAVISHSYVTTDFCKSVRLAVEPLPGPLTISYSLCVTLRTVGLSWGAVKGQCQLSRQILGNLGQSGVPVREKVNGLVLCQWRFKVPPAPLLRANSVTLQVAAPSCQLQQRSPEPVVFLTMETLRSTEALKRPFITRCKNYTK